MERDVRDPVGESGALGRPGRLATAQIVVANAIPVAGVLALGWEPLTPVFFYWLDGLLAIWGLGLVAAVVTSRQEPSPVRATGIRYVLFMAAVLAFLLAILAVPSVVAGGMMLAALDRGVLGLLRAVFRERGAWISIAIAGLSYGAQAVTELRERPAESLKATGEARANLFIHRVLAMGLLALWSGQGSPPRWALAIYVLVVAGLFTFAQLHPDRYLRLIGFAIRAARQHKV